MLKIQQKTESTTHWTAGIKVYTKRTQVTMKGIVTQIKPQYGHSLKSVVHASVDKWH